MGRPVILGNGSLTVGLNEHGLVHDFYYPYIGLENLTNSRSIDHLIGVWIDGEFSWVNNGQWEIDVDFEENALVSNVRMLNRHYGVELMFNDFVDHHENAFCRRITVANHAKEYHNIRLFIHQVFRLSKDGRADTALFVPQKHYILNYKGHNNLLIYAQTANGTPYDQFVIGNYGIEGKEGSYKDAEDGELSNNPVEHGSVDTVIRFPCSLSGGSSEQIDYWIIAADSQTCAEKIHDQFLVQGLEHRLEMTREYWRSWLMTASETLHGIDNRYLTVAQKSLMVIKAHVDKRGGIIASCDSSIYQSGRDYYSYVWPRDGAYAIWPLIRFGFQDEAKKFFEFCRDTLAPDGYLMHKYQPDKAIGSSWLPLLQGQRAELAIQEDEVAIVLFMLGEYATYHGDHDFIFNLYNTFVQPVGNFLASFIDEQTQLPHASYDLWEEKFLTTVYTTAIVYRALLVAANFAEKFEYPNDAVHWRETSRKMLDNFTLFFDAEKKIFCKGFLLQEDGSLQFDKTVDVSSFYGLMMMFSQDIPSEQREQMLTAIETTLLDKNVSGGCPRYEYDRYFASNPPHLGNPWIITTLWLAQYYLRCGRTEQAVHYIDWALEHALTSGMLPEQVNPNNGSPLSVVPLVWSHAELLQTLLYLSKSS